MFSGSDMKTLQEIIKEHPNYYLDEIVEKLEKAAKERSELLRADYIFTIGMEYQQEQLIFLDETAKDERSLSRTYGYSFKNQRVSQKVVFLRGVRYTILPALTLDGFIACDIMKGSCSQERFCSFILSHILPFMNPIPGKNSVLVMDNAKIHHNEEMINVIKSVSLKSWIKRNKDFMETCPDPEFAIIAACSQITPIMAKSFFEKSIYF
ncbi:homeodomain-like protein [Rhizophagus irregularis DAOM 181602=DAOM 197198]|nr:homeodomain-like protein [Rhizophagus irregularis DAOM 181602=DAOM 197198]